jgi:hypothetical protein
MVEAGEEINGRMILKEALNLQRSITLKYTENQFTIQMGSDNGGVNNKTRFVYRLEGFNDQWIKTPDGNADITYMGLSPGSYTLSVRMLRDDGTMGDVESQMSITILPPWYRSWWAWLFYLLTAALLVWKRKPIGRLIAGQKSRLKGMKRTAKKTAKADASSEEDIEEAVMMDDE